MANRRQADLGTVLRDLAEDTWDRLEDISAFVQRPEPFNSVRLGETTITDLAMMYLCRYAHTQSFFLQTPANRERFWGTDFEWWLGSAQIGWFRLAIQAKKLDMRKGRYLTLKHPVGGTQQIALLKNYSTQNRATPLYCLYNYDGNVTAADHWHCCQRQFRREELGCSLTPLCRVQRAINRHAKRTFDFMHRCTLTVPWQCLATCPKVIQAFRSAQSQSGVNPFPLLDPRSYYRQLPGFITVGGGADLPLVLRAAEDGQDAVYHQMQTVELGPELNDFYRIGAGFPRSIWVSNLDPNSFEQNG